MTRFARLLRVAGALALVCAATMAGPPARASDVVITYKCVAAPGPTPTPSPGSVTGDRLCTPAKGQTIDGVWKVAFNVRAGSVGRLRRVKLFVISQDPAIPSPGQGSSSSASPVSVWGDAGTSTNWSSVTSAPNSADLSYDWDSRVLTPYNAKYTIRVEALSHTDEDTEASFAERKDVAVDNPPIKPKPPVTAVGEQGSIAVGWQAAAEPDVLWYTVLRARTDRAEFRPVSGEFEPIFERIDRLAVTDTVHAPGAYWYSVQVARKSVVARDGFVTARSDSSVKGAVVESTDPTPEPTPRPTAGPTPPPPRLPDIVPKPLPVLKPPPVPDAPFSAVLPYEAIPQVEVEEDVTPPPQAIAEPARVVTNSRGALFPVAIGAFLVSAALTLGRIPA